MNDPTEQFMYTGKSQSDLSVNAANESCAFSTPVKSRVSSGLPWAETMEQEMLNSEGSMEVEHPACKELRGYLNCLPSRKSLTSVYPRG